MTGEPAPAGNLAWVEQLTPWPDHFGLERMHELLADLGHPERAYRSVHVVGTNGKTSTTLGTALLLRAEGLHVGATISPHIAHLAERVQVDGVEAEIETALGRVRPVAAGATQFEVLIAAALAEFAARGVDAAVVEAGLGGRLDATNVLAAPVVVLTNVALEHTEWLGETREAIAAEKLAVVTPGAHVVLGEPEWEQAARHAGAATVEIVQGSNADLAVAAASALLGRTVDPAPLAALHVPGRLERRGERPLELRDGAHNPAGVAYLLSRLPRHDFVVVASILRDKDVDAMLDGLATVGGTLVATTSHNERALPAAELAAHARTRFGRVEIEPDPVLAVARARALAGPDGAVLVTGSLYMLSELAVAEAAVRLSPGVRGNG